MFSICRECFGQYFSNLIYAFHKAHSTFGLMPLSIFLAIFVLLLILLFLFCILAAISCYDRVIGFHLNFRIFRYIFRNRWKAWEEWFTPIELGTKKGAQFIWHEILVLLQQPLVFRHYRLQVIPLVFQSCYFAGVWMDKLFDHRSEQDLEKPSPVDFIFNS